eukprot:COSAG05_NODE_1121_length_5808_cov_2.774391_3_plen_53_part_00
MIMIIIIVITVVVGDNIGAVFYRCNTRHKPLLPPVLRHLHTTLPGGTTLHTV